MTQKLHLTSVGEPHFVGEIVEGFRLGLRGLGHDVTSEYAQVDPSRVNIIMFAAAAPLRWKDLSHLAPNCILVNFEQLIEGGNGLKPSYLEILRNSYVWEYSAQNLQRYAQFGIPHACLVPFGYQSGAIHSPPDTASAEEDIDILFFGSLSPRREHLLQALSARGMHVVAHHALPPKERSALLSRAKLMLNASYLDNSKITEISRLAVGFVAKKAVLTEIYDDSEIPERLRPGFFGAPYEMLVETAERLISDRAARHARAQRGHELFTATSQASFLQPALEAFFSWRDGRPGR
jgi:hypothetical protein